MAGQKRRGRAGQSNARQGQGKGSGMAGRLRRPIIIVIIFCFLSLLKGHPWCSQKTVGHYLCNLHGGYAPGYASIGSMLKSRSVHEMGKSDCACAASDVVVGITEVKQHRARLVLGWVTAWEHRGCGWRDSNPRPGSKL